MIPSNTTVTVGSVEHRLRYTWVVDGPMSRGQITTVGVGRLAALPHQPVTTPYPFNISHAATARSLPTSIRLHIHPQVPSESDGNSQWHNCHGQLPAALAPYRAPPIFIQFAGGPKFTTTWYVLVASLRHLLVHSFIRFVT